MGSHGRVPNNVALLQWVPASPTAPAPPSWIDIVQKIRILLVDDNQAVRRAVRSLLAFQDDLVVCGEACDGVEAIDCARELRPDAVFMDVSMPRMDGLEATRALRQEFPGTKVILISQNDPALVRRQAAEVGADAFVPKAELARDLLPTVASLFARDHRAAAMTEPPKGSAPRDLSHPQGHGLFGGGTMGRLIREYDWSKTPLGPIDSWQPNLRNSVNLMLNSQHPMWIGWGPEMIFLYNDAYVSVISLAKHPWALGRPTREVWAEIWDVVEPLSRKVFVLGEPSFLDNVRLFMSRGESLEETYYSFSYSPIYDDSGKVAGLFCPSAETSADVLHARRLETLSALSARALVEKSPRAACESLIQTLAANPDDIPFALLYLVEEPGDRATLQSTSRIVEPYAVAPREIPLSMSAAQQDIWPVAEVIESGCSQAVSVRNLSGLPEGAGSQPVIEALALPLVSGAEVKPLGVLVVGVNPTRRLDSDYRMFFTLVADQIATAIQNTRAAEQEKKRLEALAEIDRAKTAFFSNVSHEFRTPLTLMLAPLQDLLARSQTHLSSTAKDQLELVNRNGARLLRLVNTLLDFSRIEAGRSQAAYEATDISSLTADLASVFRSATDRAGLKLSVDCAPIGEPVYLDRDMWEKIVLNLISNAFKFTFDGEIAVSTHRLDRAVELRVRDTGVGIPPGEMPRLFERFHRIPHTRSRTYEGTGIGLALVQELVKLHVGSIRAESAAGHGTTFIVTIPLGQKHLPAGQVGGSAGKSATAVGAAPFVQEALRWLPDAAASADESATWPESFAEHSTTAPHASDRASVDRPRVIVADDNADMRQYVARLLAERFEVHTVPDGAAALAAARELHPDAIVSDVMMPHLDGLGVLRELRANPALKEIPIILLSARAGEESRLEGIEAGADDYLVKPFSSRELIASVDANVKMHRARLDSHRHQREAERNNGLLASIVGSSDDAIISKDLDGVVTSWNSAAERIFGYSAAEAVGRHITLIIPLDRHSEENDIISRIRLGERVDHFETVRKRKDGALIDISLTISPIRNADGVIIGASKVARDVTDRKRAEERERYMAEESAAATAKFRAVFEQTTQFAGIMRNDGLVIDINRLSLDVCGYTAEQVLGKFFWDTAWWRNFPESQEKIRRATPLAAQGIPYREILPYSFADGTERVVDFALYPIRDDHGRVLYLHPTGVDITDQKRAEEGYRHLTQRLEQQVRLRTAELQMQNEQVHRQADLLRDLSQRLMRAQDEERRHIARELHDSSGQLLTALAINLSQIVRRVDDKKFALVATADESLQIVHQLSQEIRTMSYLLHPPLLEETGVAEALAWYIDGFNARSGIEMKLHLDTDLERFDNDTELAIFRIVQEALTNIHRHSGSSTGEIRMAQQDDEILVAIVDHGKGMPAEKLTEINSGAAGVGFRGMRERVHQLHGKMKVESDASGTKLSVALPVIPQPPTSISFSVGNAPTHDVASHDPDAPPNPTPEPLPARRSRAV
jgi:PAS domain S-box-containing protein